MSKIPVKRLYGKLCASALFCAFRMVHYIPFVKMEQDRAGEQSSFQLYYSSKHVLSPSCSHNTMQIVIKQFIFISNQFIVKEQRINVNETKIW